MNRIGPSTTAQILMLLAILGIAILALFGKLGL